MIDRVQTNDALLNRVQDATRKALAPVLENPIVGSQILESVSLVAGSNVIDHKLGRKLQGWVIVRQRGPVAPTTVITNLTAYTPTVAGLGAGGAATNSARWRRVGDCMQINEAFIKDGTPGSGASLVTFTVPSPYLIDTAKLAGQAVVGFADTYAVEAVGAYHTTSVDVRSTTTVALHNLGTGSIYTGADFRAGCQVDFWITLPIVGWSINDSSFIQAYDTQDSNLTPELTLQLVSSGTATVDLLVF